MKLPNGLTDLWLNWSAEGNIKCAPMNFPSDWLPNTFIANWRVPWISPLIKSFQLALQFVLYPCSWIRPSLIVAVMGHHGLRVKLPLTRQYEDVGRWANYETTCRTLPQLLHWMDVFNIYSSLDSSLGSEEALNKFTVNHFTFSFQ